MNHSSRVPIILPDINNDLTQVDCATNDTLWSRQFMESNMDASQGTSRRESAKPSITVTKNLPLLGKMLHEAGADMNFVQQLINTAIGSPMGITDQNTKTASMPRQTLAIPRPLVLSYNLEFFDETDDIRILAEWLAGERMLNATFHKRNVDPSDEPCDNTPLEVFEDILAFRKHFDDTYTPIRVKVCDYNALTEKFSVISEDDYSVALSYQGYINAAAQVKEYGSELPKYIGLLRETVSGDNSIVHQNNQEIVELMDYISAHPLAHEIYTESKHSATDILSSLSQEEFIRLLHRRKDVQFVQCTRLCLRFDNYYLDTEIRFLNRLFCAQRLKTAVERSHILHQFIEVIDGLYQYLDGFGRGEYGASIDDVPLLPIVRALHISPLLSATSGAEFSIGESISPRATFFEDILIKYFANDIQINQLLAQEGGNYYNILDEFLTDAERDFRFVQILCSMHWCRTRNESFDEFLTGYGINPIMTDVSVFARTYTARHTFPVLSAFADRRGRRVTRTFILGRVPVLTYNTTLDFQYGRDLHSPVYYLTERIVTNETQGYCTNPLVLTVDHRRHEQLFAASKAILATTHCMMVTPYRDVICAFHDDVYTSLRIDFLLFPVHLSSSFPAVYVSEIIKSVSLSNSAKQKWYNDAKERLPNSLAMFSNQDFKTLLHYIVHNPEAYSLPSYDAHVKQQKLNMADYWFTKKKLADSIDEPIFELAKIHSSNYLDNMVTVPEYFSLVNGWEPHFFFEALTSFYNGAISVIENILIQRLIRLTVPIIVTKQCSLTLRICNGILYRAFLEVVENSYVAFLHMLAHNRRIPELLEDQGVVISRLNALLDFFQAQAGKTREILADGVFNYRLEKVPYALSQCITTDSSLSLKENTDATNHMFNPKMAINAAIDDIFNLSTEGMPGGAPVQTLLVDVPQIQDPFSLVPLLDVKIHMTATDTSYDPIIGLYSILYNDVGQLGRAYYRRCACYGPQMDDNTVDSPLILPDPIRINQQFLPQDSHFSAVTLQSSACTTIYSDLLDSSDIESDDESQTEQQFYSPSPSFCLYPSKDAIMKEFEALFQKFDIFPAQFQNFPNYTAAQPKNDPMPQPDYRFAYTQILVAKLQTLDYIESCFKFPSLLLDVLAIIGDAIFDVSIDKSIREWADALCMPLDLVFYENYHCSDILSTEELQTVLPRDKHQLDATQSDIKPTATQPSVMVSNPGIPPPETASGYQISYRATQTKGRLSTSFADNSAARIYMDQIVAAGSQILARSEVKELVFTQVISRFLFFLQMHVFVSFRLCSDRLRYGFLSLDVSPAKYALDRRITGMLCALGSMITIRTWTLVEYSSKICDAALTFCMLVPQTPEEWYYLKAFVSSSLDTVAKINADVIEEASLYNSRILSVLNIAQYGNLPRTSHENRMPYFYQPPEAYPVFNGRIFVPLSTLGRSFENFSLDNIESMDAPVPGPLVLSGKPLAVTPRIPDKLLRSNRVGPSNQLPPQPGTNVAARMLYPDIISTMKTTQWSLIFNALCGPRFQPIIVQDAANIGRYLYGKHLCMGFRANLRNNVLRNLDALLYDTRQRLTEELDSERDNLLKRQQLLLDEVEIFSKKIPSAFNFDEHSTELAVKAFIDIEAHAKTLEKIQAQCTSFLQNEKYLGLLPSSFALLDTIGPRVRLLYRLWSIVTEHGSDFPVWYNSVLVDLAHKYGRDMATLSEFQSTILDRLALATGLADEMAAAARHETSKSVVSSLYNGEHIIRRVELDLKWLKHFMPVILALLSPALKKRHIDQLRTRGLVINMYEHTLSKFVERRIISDIGTSDDFTRKPFTSRAYLILDVIDTAKKEYEIETTFQQIEVNWRQISFEFRPYELDPAGTVLMANFDQIFRQHTVDMQTLARLLQSQHVSPVQRQIQAFTEKLSSLRSFVDLAYEIQTLWTWMYPLYINSSAKNILDVSPFQSLSDSLKRTLQAISQTPNIQYAISLAGNVFQVDKVLVRNLGAGTLRFEQLPANTLLLPMLHYYQAALQHFKEGVNSFLAMKRKIYPRFCFLNKATLVKMFSDMRARRDTINSLLYQFFGFIDHKCADSRGTKMASVLTETGEAIALSTVVDLSAEYDEWLRNFEVELHHSMRQQYHSLYTQVIKQGADPTTLCAAVPMCLLSVITRMQFTIKLEEILYPAASTLSITLKGPLPQQRNMLTSDASDYRQSRSSSLTGSRAVRSMAQSLQSSDAEIVRSLEQYHHALLESIQTCREQFLACEEKQAYTHHLMDLMYLRDTVSAMIKTGKSSDIRFLFAKVFKYRHLEGDSLSAYIMKANNNLEPGELQKSSDNSFEVVVEALTHSMFFRFGFVTDARRGIFTSMVEKCTLTLFRCIASRTHGGYISGPSGKTEVVKAFSYLTGHCPLILNIADRHSLSPETLHQIILTTSSLGTLICLEDIHLLSVEQRRLLAMDLSYVYNSLRQGSRRISLPPGAASPVGTASLNLASVYILTDCSGMSLSFKCVFKSVTCNMTEKAIKEMITYFVELVDLRTFNGPESDASLLSGQSSFVRLSHLNTSTTLPSGSSILNNAGMLSYLVNRLYSLMTIVQSLIFPFCDVRYIKSIITEMFLLSNEQSMRDGSLSSRDSTQQSSLDELCNQTFRSVLEPAINSLNRLLLHQLLDNEFGKAKSRILDPLTRNIRRLFLDPIFLVDLYRRVHVVVPFTPVDHASVSSISTPELRTRFDNFVTVVRDFITTVRTNVGTCVLGGHLCGKSSFIKLASQVYARLFDTSVTIVPLSLPSLTTHQLFGHASADGKDWVDGIVSSFFRSRETAIIWLVLDGIEKLDVFTHFLSGSVCLPSGELLQPNNNVKIIVEHSLMQDIPQCFAAKCGFFSMDTLSLNTTLCRSVIRAVCDTDDVFFGKDALENAALTNRRTSRQSAAQLSSLTALNHNSGPPDISVASAPSLPSTTNQLAYIPTQTALEAIAVRTGQFTNFISVCASAVLHQTICIEPLLQGISSLNLLVIQFFRVYTAILRLWGRSKYMIANRLTELPDICLLFSIFHSFGLYLTSQETQNWLDYIVRLAFRLITDVSKPLSDIEKQFILMSTSDVFGPDIIAHLQRMHTWQTSAENQLIRPKLLQSSSALLTLPSTIMYCKDLDSLRNAALILPRKSLFEIIYDPVENVWVRWADMTILPPPLAAEPTQLLFAPPEDQLPVNHLCLSSVYGLYLQRQYASTQNFLRSFFLAYVLLLAGCDILVCGEQDSGKTSLVHALFNSNPNLFDNSQSYFHVTSECCVPDMKEMLLSQMTMNADDTYSLGTAHKAFVVIDDTEILSPRSWEMLREVSTHKSWFANDAHIKVQNITIIMCMRTDSRAMNEHTLNTGFLLYMPPISQHLQDICVHKVPCSDPQLSIRFVAATLKIVDQLTKEAKTWLENTTDIIDESLALLSARSTNSTHSAASIALDDSAHGTVFPVFRNSIVLHIFDRMTHLDFFHKMLSNKGVLFRLWLHETIKEISSHCESDVYKHVDTLARSVALSEFSHDPTYYIPSDLLFTYVFNTSHEIDEQVGYRDNIKEHSDARSSDDNHEASSNTDTADSEGYISLVKYVEITGDNQAFSSSDKNATKTDTENRNSEDQQEASSLAKRMYFVSSSTILSTVNAMTRILGSGNIIVVGGEGTGRSTCLRKACDILRFSVLEFHPVPNASASPSEAWDEYLRDIICNKMFTMRICALLPQDVLTNDILKDSADLHTVFTVQRFITSDTLTQLATQIKDTYLDIFGSLIEANHIGINELTIMLSRIVRERVRIATILNKPRHDELRRTSSVLFRYARIVFVEPPDSATLSEIAMLLIPDLRPEKSLLQNTLTKLHSIGYQSLLCHANNSCNRNYIKLFINMTLAYFSFYHTQKKALTQYLSNCSVGIEYYNRMEKLKESAVLRHTKLKEIAATQEEAADILNSDVQLAREQQVVANRALQEVTERLATVTNTMSALQSKIDSDLRPHEAALTEARRDVLNIPVKDLAALRSITKPDRSEQLIFKMILLLVENTVLEGEPYIYWIPCRKIISTPSLLPMLFNQGFTNLRADVLLELGSIFGDEAFSDSRLVSSNSSMPVLATWGRCMHGIAVTQQSLSRTVSELEQAKKSRDELLSIQSSKRQGVLDAEKATSAAIAHLTDGKLDSDNTGIKVLEAFEQNRRLDYVLLNFRRLYDGWVATTNDPNFMAYCSGDALLTCCMVNYGGCMTTREKASYLKAAQKVLDASDIKYTDQDMSNIIYNRYINLAWVSGGLKNDTNALLSAQILNFVLSGYQCYSYVHDPNGFLREWLTRFCSFGLLGGLATETWVSDQDTSAHMQAVCSSSSEKKLARSDECAANIIINTASTDFITLFKESLTSAKTVIVDIMPNFSYESMAGIVSTLANLSVEDAQNRVVFYNSNISDTAQDLFNIHTTFQENLYYIDATDYNFKAYVVSLISSVSNPEIELSISRCIVDIATAHERAEKQETKLFELLEHHLSQNTNTVLDDVLLHTTIVECFDRYNDAQSQIAQSLKRLCIKEDARNDYEYVALKAISIRSIIHQQAERDSRFLFNFDFILSDFKNLAALYLEHNGVVKVTPENAELLLFETFITHVSRALPEDERIFFELNLALIREYDATTLVHNDMRCCANDILLFLGNSLESTKAFKEQQLSLSSEHAVLETQMITISGAAFDKLQMMEASGPFSTAFSGLCKHMASNPDKWDKFVDLFRPELITAIPGDLLGRIPPYLSGTRPPLSIALVLVHAIDCSRSIVAVKSYIKTTLPFSGPCTLRSVLTDPRLEKPFSIPYLLLTEDTNMLNTLTYLANCVSVKLKFCFSLGEVRSYMSTKSWVVIPDVNTDIEKDLISFIKDVFFQAASSNVVHKDFKLLIVPSMKPQSTSTELSRSTLKVSWPLEHSWKHTLLSLYKHNFNDLYLRPTNDNMRSTFVMNTIIYYATLYFSVMDSRLTRTSWANVQDFLSSISEIKKLYLNVMLRGVNLSMDYSLSEIVGSVSFDGLCHIISDLYLNEAIADTLDLCEARNLLARLLDRRIFDMDSMHGTVLSKYSLNCFSLFNVVQTNNTNIISEINTSIPDLENMELLNLDTYCDDIRAWNQSKALSRLIVGTRINPEVFKVNLYSSRHFLEAEAETGNSMTFLHKALMQESQQRNGTFIHDGKLISQHFGELLHDSAPQNIILSFSMHPEKIMLAVRLHFALTLATSVDRLSFKGSLYDMDEKIPESSDALIVSGLYLGAFSQTQYFLLRDRDPGSPFTRRPVNLALGCAPALYIEPPVRVWIYPGCVPCDTNIGWIEDFTGEEGGRSFLGLYCRDFTS